jgi:hypothetical protein
MDKYLCIVIYNFINTQIKSYSPDCDGKRFSSNNTIVCEPDHVSSTLRRACWIFSKTLCRTFSHKVISAKTDPYGHASARGKSQGGESKPPSGPTDLVCSPGRTKVANARCVVSAVRVKMRVLFAHPPYLGVAVAEGSAKAWQVEARRGWHRPMAVCAPLYGGGA